MISILGIYFVNKPIVLICVSVHSKCILDINLYIKTTILI